MGLTSTGPERVALAKWQFLGLLGVAGLATGASGVMVWKMASTRANRLRPW